MRQHFEGEYNAKIHFYSASLFFLGGGVSTLKPCVACHAIDRHKGDDERSAFDIGLELGVATVVLRLTQLQTSRTAEHHIDDTYVAERGDDPLPRCAACTKADHKATRPHQDLTKVVGATYDTI